MPLSDQGTNWFQRHLRPLTIGTLAAVAYVAAVSRGQTLPWAIAALLSTTLVWGLAWPHWLIRRLDIQRSGPTRATEGEFIQLRLHVKNTGWLPRFMVELTDHIPFVNGANSGGNQVSLGLVPFLPGKSQTAFDTFVTCEKRGRHLIGPVGLASSFPLGLTRATQTRHTGQHTLTVYPRLFPVIDLPFLGSPNRLHGGMYLLPDGTGMAEYAGLREYRRGDHPRHIHWPTTARLNELMVKEFEPQASPRLVVILDNGRASNRGQGRESTFEYAVRIAASVASHACLRDIPTQLMLSESGSPEIPAGTGEAQRQAILDTLAIVEAESATPYAQTLQRAGGLCQRGDTALVFLSVPADQITPTLQALASLHAQGVHLLTVVFDRPSFSPAHAERPSAPWTPALLELGACCFHVRQGDDLLKVFHP